MTTLLDIIHILALFVYIIALIVTIIFWKMLKNEKHWLGIPISLFFFFLHDIFEYINIITGTSMEIYAELSEIFAGITLAISLFYIIIQLKKID